jgi:chromosome segregation ATPase
MKIDSATVRLTMSILLAVPTGAALTSCATQSEMVTAKGEVAQVKGNLSGLENTVERRQTAMGEEILSLKEDLRAIEGRNEEFRQTLDQIQQKMNVQKIETNENFKHLANLNLDYQKTLSGQLQRLTGKLQNIDISLATLDQQVREINALEEDQNRRLGEAANRLSIFIEEADLEHGRLQKGIVGMSQDYNKLAERINLLQKKLAGVQSGLSDAQAKLKDTQAKLKDTQAKLSDARAKLSDVQAYQRASGPRFHEVASGENLSLIAAKYGVSVDELTRINGLSNPNAITVGQKIRLPGP